MAGRIRSIKPEWIEDERFNACSDAAIRVSKVFYALVDDEGRVKRSVRAIGLDTWKFCDRITDKSARAKEALDELVACGWLIAYEVGGEQCWAIRNWSKHQRISHATPSKIPSPPDFGGTPPESSGERTSAPESSRDLRPDLDLEGKGSGGEGSACAPLPEAETQRRPKPIDPMGRVFAKRPEPSADHLGIADVERMFSELRVAAKRGRYSSHMQRDDERLAHLAKFANDGGATRAERDAVLRACILGFLGDPDAAPRWPIAFLANDPGGYQAMHEGRPTSSTTGVGRARAAFDAATTALRGKREERDALVGKPGHAEAVAEYLRLQGELRKAGDALEFAKRAGDAA